MEKLNLFKITEPPQDFKYPEFVWRKTILKPFCFLQKNQIEIYSLIVDGYRPPDPDLEYHELPTKDIVDITIETPGDKEEQQYLKVTLHANENTRAKDNVELYQEFHVNNVYYRGIKEAIDDLRYMYLRRMLTNESVIKDKSMPQM